MRSSPRWLHAPAALDASQAKTVQSDRLVPGGAQSRDPEIGDPTTMKRIAAIVSASVLATILAFGSHAGAQPNAQRAGSAAPRTVTADYTEQSVGGDQVITFTGDELPAPANGFDGGVIRPLPGVIRLGLIRPRVNFVAELLKSVENL